MAKQKAHALDVVRINVTGPKARWFGEYNGQNFRVIGYRPGFILNGKRYRPLYVLETLSGRKDPTDMSPTIHNSGLRPGVPLTQFFATWVDLDWLSASSGDFDVVEKFSCIQEKASI